MSPGRDPQVLAGVPTKRLAALQASAPGRCYVGRVEPELASDTHKWNTTHPRELVDETTADTQIAGQLVDVPERGRFGGRIHASRFPIYYKRSSDMGLAGGRCGNGGEPG
jgi:hypothetical protein